jgi:hypothetical protein
MGPEEVAAFLRARSWCLASKIAPIAHGEWSRAFSFAVDDGGEYVVRFSELDEDFRKDQVAARYATPALPIPRILELGQAFDGFYAIAERAYGTFVDALDAQQLRRSLPALWERLCEPTWRGALLCIESGGGVRTSGVCQPSRPAEAGSHLISNEWTRAYRSPRSST